MNKHCPCVGGGFSSNCMEPPGVRTRLPFAAIAWLDLQQEARYVERSGPHFRLPNSSLSPDPLYSSLTLHQDRAKRQHSFDHHLQHIPRTGMHEVQGGA